MPVLSQTNGVACLQQTMDDIISEERPLRVFACVNKIVLCSCDPEARPTTNDLTFNEDKSMISVKPIKTVGFEVSKGQMRSNQER